MQRILLITLAALVCLIVNFRKVKTRKVWNFARLDFLGRNTYSPKDIRTQAFIRQIIF